MTNKEKYCMVMELIEMNKSWSPDEVVEMANYLEDLIKEESNNKA